MAYSLASTILGILPGLPQTTSSAQYTQTVSIIDSHITRADAMIDSYLSRRYTIPLATTATSAPPVVAQISQDITSYFTYRSLFTRDNTNRSEYLDDLFNAAVDTLKMIQKGDLDLVNTDGSVVTPVGSGNLVYATNEDYIPFFGPDESTEWKFDPNLLDEWRGNRGT